MTVRTEHSNSGYFWLTVSRTPVRAGNTNPLRIVSKEKILVIRLLLSDLVLSVSAGTDLTPPAH